MSKMRVSLRGIFLAVLSLALGTNVCAQTVSRLNILDTHAEDGSIAEVDAEVVVNFYDPRERLLFVHQDGFAIFIDTDELSDRKSLNEVTLGSKLRIKGSFDGQQYRLLARQIEVTGHGPPQSPLPIDLSSADPGHGWSHRVQLEGTIEAIATRQAQTVYVVSSRGKRFLWYHHVLPNQEELPVHLGAEMKSEGTLAYEIDDFDRPSTPILYSGANDPYSIASSGKPGPPATQSENFSLIDRLGAEARHEVIAQVVFQKKPNIIYLQDDQRNLRSVATPLHSLFNVGDVVSATIRTSKESKSTSRNQEPSQTLHAEILRFLNNSLLPPPKPIDKVKGMGPERVWLSGELVAFQTVGFWRYAEVESDTGTHLVRVKAMDEEFEALDLDQARIVKATGLLETNSFPEISSADRMITLAGVSDLVVQRRIGDTGRTIAVVLGISTIALILLGVPLMWRLRRQIANKTKDLQEVSSQLKSSYDAIQEALLVIDDDGKIVGSNAQVSKILRVDPAKLQLNAEAEPTSIANLLSEKFADSDGFSEFWADAMRNPTKTIHCELTTRESPERTLHVYTAPVATEPGAAHSRVWTFDDVSEKKRLEAELTQSQKMDAVGRLAGGVAHDFNNLLLAMSANLELIQLDRNQKVSETAEYLGAVEQATVKAKDLVQRLLGFSRKAPLNQKVDDLNQVVLGTYQLLERTLDSRIRLELDLMESPALACFDESQIGQVLLNICLNSRDAIGQQDGVINIATEFVPSDRSPLEQDSIRVVVKDNGEGIPAECIPKVFDPFFTTKPPDQGTGLGLATSYGIIQQHGGEITCASEPGNTRFNVYLVSVTGDTPDANLEAPSSITETRGTVLLVDDDASVSQPMSKLLQHHGHNVSLATSGHECLEELERNQTLVDAVILDLSMPGMPGQEVLSQIKHRFPDIPVIICSGYLHELERLNDDESTRPFAMIAKPFRAEQLIRTLDSAIRNS